MSLTFNSSGGGNSAHTLSGNLNFAVVNIHLPTGPIVREFEFEDNPIPAGQEFSLTIPDVKPGSFLVQFLGVYESDGQASKFAYGDATAVVVSGVNNQVNITTAEIGSFTTEGQVSGRYIDSLSEPLGPTGDLVMQFQPPDLSKPKMNIHPFPMVQGWFSLLALDGAKMDYVLLPGNQVIFKDVQLNGGNLEIDGVVQSSGAHLAKFSAPAHYIAESGNGEIRSIPPSDLWIGYFKHASLSPGVLSGKQVCYASVVEEAIPGAFLTRTGNVLSVPLEVDLDTGTASEIRRVQGGTGATMTNLYVESGVGCTATGADKIIVYHNMLADDGERAAGMSPPFKAIRPFARWDRFVSASYAEPASVPTIKIEWDLISSLHSSALTGVAILAKRSTGGDGGGGDKRCNDLLAQGYSEIGATNSLATESFLFSGPVTASNRHEWTFALCGYYQPAAGPRAYVGRPVRGGHIGGDENLIHTGWAPAFKTLAASPTTYDYETEGGEIFKVSNVNASGSTLYTSLTVVGAPATITAGDEVMLTIVAKSATGNCGVHNGNVNDTGKYGFARVMGVAGSSIKIAKGTFVDQVDSPVNAHINQTVFTSPFCFLQVQRVLQYRNLNLTSATDFTSTSGGNPSFNYGGAAVGQIPIRVNGVLTLGPSISVTGGGFQGGNGTYPTGAGITGPTLASGPNGNGGQGNLSGGAGGAGFGSGGSGAAVMTPGSMASMNSLSPLIRGGGGGHGNVSDGGHGGGNIFIAARATVVPGASVISANGTAGLGSVGGGGGGGSIFLMTGTLTGAGTLSLQANGGNGSGGSAGVGGGGGINAIACNGGALIGGSAARGTTGNISGANNGFVNIMSATNQPHMCQLIQ